jgi:hypothetical protein
MDSTLKSLTITGSAVEDATRSRQKMAGSRKRRLIVKDEEDDFIEKAKAINPVIPRGLPVSKEIPNILPRAAQVPMAQMPRTQVPMAQMPMTQVPQATQFQQKFEGESTVILKPLKHPRVKLQPKITVPTKVLENTTRKARRIQMTVSNLNHRFTRAKKLKDDSEKKSVETIRNYLVEKGVIQPMSKAPERMLRSMYSDFMLLKDHAL